MILSNEESYQEALAKIEILLEQAEDSPEDPSNKEIDELCAAVKAYEDQDAELLAFELRAMSE